MGRNRRARRAHVPGSRTTRGACCAGARGWRQYSLVARVLATRDAVCSFQQGGQRSIGQVSRTTPRSKTRDVYESPDPETRSIRQSSSSARAVAWSSARTASARDANASWSAAGVCFSSVATRQIEGERSASAAFPHPKGGLVFSRTEMVLANVQHPGFTVAITDRENRIDLGPLERRRMPKTPRLAALHARCCSRWQRGSCVTGRRPRWARRRGDRESKSACG